MAFVLLIVEKREDRLSRPKEVGRRMFDQMVRFCDSLQARGVLRAVESLKPDTEGVRIETRGGKRSHDRRPICRGQGVRRRVLPRSSARPRSRRSPSRTNAPPPNGPRSKSARPGRATGIEARISTLRALFEFS